MTVVHDPLRWKTKPDLPGGINRSHQLARGLAFYALDCRGVVCSLIRPGVAQTPGVRPPASSFGNAMIGNAGLHAAGVTDGQYFDQAVYPEIQITGDKSWACGVYKTASTGNWSRPFCRTANHGSSAPYANFDFEINPAGDGQGRIKWLVATTGTSMVESEPAFDVIADLTYYTLAGSAQLNGNMLGYTQGVQRTSAGVTSLDSYNTNAPLVIGGDNDAGTAQWVGAVPWVAIWSRVLSADEMLLLHAEPYALLQPRIRRTYWSSGSVGVLSGSSDAVSGATATVRGTGALSSTSAVTSGATSTLSGTAAATGTGVVTSGATSTLSGRGALSGTCAVTSGMTGTLAQAGSAITGQIQVASDALATLTGTGRITAAAAATSSTVAVLRDAEYGIWDRSAGSSTTWAAIAAGAGTWIPVGAWDDVSGTWDGLGTWDTNPSTTWTPI